ncbi:hypothetical protein [Myxococcus xanthus]|uniref:hypothetical protein n=1 Tax=Myxococcus xanthus TaxID=34 RepID=UPI001F26FCED|nr:hypothetical protein [Myxococcus xanthus]
MARQGEAAGEVEALRGRVEQWRLTRARQGRMPEALWRAAVSAAQRYGVSHVARALGVGHAALKARTSAAHQPCPQAGAAGRPDGFVEVSAAQLLGPGPASSLVIEYVAREGSRLTLTVPASCQGFDVPALVAALRGP